MPPQASSSVGLHRARPPPRPQEETRDALGRVAPGELGRSPDTRCPFVCTVCGATVYDLDQVVQHESQCSGVAPAPKLSTASGGAGDGAVAPAWEGGGCNDLAAKLAAELAALRHEVGRWSALKTCLDGAGALNCADGDGDPLKTCLDRLRDVVENASFRDESKYRRIRLSNAAFHMAIGRWQAALRVLEVVGFKRTQRALKRGDEPEPHLVLGARLSAGLLQVVIAALEGEVSPPPEASCSASLPTGWTALMEPPSDVSPRPPPAGEESLQPAAAAAASLPKMLPPSELVPSELGGARQDLEGTPDFEEAPKDVMPPSHAHADVPLPPNLRPHTRTPATRAARTKLGPGPTSYEDLEIDVADFLGADW